MTTLGLDKFGYFKYLQVILENVPSPLLHYLGLSHKQPLLPSSFHLLSDPRQPQGFLPEKCVRKRVEKRSMLLSLRAKNRAKYLANTSHLTPLFARW